MASIEAIYISSDEEGGGRKKSNPKKRQSLQDRAPKPKTRANSADLTRRAHIEPVRRSGSAPGMFTVPSVSISTVGSDNLPPGENPIPKISSEPIATPSTLTEKAQMLKRPTGTPDPNTNLHIQSLSVPGGCTHVLGEDKPVSREDDMGSLQPTTSSAAADTASILDLYPPIEPLHFPERYAIAPVEKAADNMGGNRSGNLTLPTVSPSVSSSPNDSANSRPPVSSLGLPYPEATDAISQPSNSKRKHSESGAGPQKRTRFVPVPYTPCPRSFEYSERDNTHSPAPFPGQMLRPPLLSTFPRAPLNTSNPNLWAVPAYDARMDNNPGIPNRSPLAPSSAAGRNGTPGGALPAATERKSPQPGQKKRAKRWNCGIIADMGTELQRCFNAQAFADKHEINVKDVHKVFEIYIHKPLFAFAVRGQSRAKMKEFNETLREYDKREKESPGSSAHKNPTVAGKGKKAMADRSKRQDQANS